MAESGAAQGSADRLLIVRAFWPHALFHDFVRAAAARLASDGGHVLAAQPLHRVQAIEPGSLPAHLWIARLKPSGVEAILALVRATDTPGPAASLVLSVPMVDPALWGDGVPTAANVAVTPSLEPPTYLLIEGSAEDQGRMDRYRDIILPMMRERAAYYVAFELGGAVQVLSGTWSEAIFAISRWPSPGHALDFWLSHRYQREAIPLRLDIGRFTVLMATGEADG